jgi:Trypsin-like peptidase domain
VNPLNGVGMLFEERKLHQIFLGTCFAFRHRNYFLTADHCVRDRKIAALSVAHPFEGVFTRIATIHSHPTADLAVVTLANQGKDKTEPFLDLAANYGLGEEFVAYGFPEDTIGPNEGQPTARLFRGYYQRFMEHKSHMGYAYVAGELSMPCPGGLSGGPLFRPGAPKMITGLVTENLEATTLLDSEESTLHDGTQVHEHYRRVINYGVALMLAELADWINQYVPTRAT